jgi:predicted lysophospholipase L1 biosynthesis ABC-type transport system permease subunit
MNQQQEQLEAIREIRSLMERSSRFLSLSGLSGVIIGILALAGVAAAYVFLGISPAEPEYHQYATDARGVPDTAFYRFFLADALIVLVLSLLTGSLMAARKARKLRQPAWDGAARRLLVNLAIPLVAGGLYCLILMYHGQFRLVAPATLLFYGLALLNAGKYTIDDLRYLGILNILTGLAASWFADYGLLFWGFGFGLLHIAYGIVIHYRYER